MNEKKLPAFKPGERVELHTAPPGFPLGNEGAVGRVTAVTEEGYTVRFEGVFTGTVPGIPENCLVGADEE
jgi:hypothetical protein